MARAAGRIARQGGKIGSYRVDARYGAALPSRERIRDVIRQAKRQGATRVGIVADVDSFQSYEQTRGSRHLVRAFRQGAGGSPDALRGRLAASNLNSRAAILAELRAATGAEDIHGLRGVQFNFYYG